MNIETLIEILIALATIVPFLLYYFLQKKIDHTYKVKELYLEDKFKDKDRQITFLIENHKITLQLLSYKENKLHDKRIEVIAELYGKLVGLQFEMNGLINCSRFIVAPFEIDDIFNKEKSEMCINLHNDFYLFYLKHKLYFSKKTCEPIDEIQLEFRDSINKYSSSQLFIKEDFEYSYRLIKEASENMATKIPNILAIIENDFKTIIGSDIELLKN